jgi:ParB-like chromosome segregation protein Spo0J
MFNKKNMKPILRYIDISKLKVDLKNPRYNDKKIINNIKKWTHQELEKIIEEEDIKDIKNSIQIDGIRDPLWVVKDGEEDEFIVIEGNRRLVTLHTLIKEGVSSPTGKKFESVPCNILSSELSESEINKQRILLQGGKKKMVCLQCSICD